MSELTKLLEGVKVEWKNLGKVLKIKNGKGYKGYKPGNVPVYGSGGIMTYIDTYVCNKPSVLIPRKGSLKNLFYLNEPFWTVDTIFWTDIITEIVNPKFVFHCLKTRNLEDLNVAGGVPSLTQTVLNKILIPIPCPDNPEKSLKIQEEIVRILDSLSEETNQLTAALQKELDLHQKHYNFYREELFKFEGKDVEWRILGDVLKIKNGKDYKSYRKGEIAVYGSGGVLSYIDTHIFDKPSVLIPRKGSLKNLFYVTDPFWTVDTIFWTQININVVEPKYVFHYLLTQRLEKLNMAGGVPSLTQTILNKVPIPVPTLQEQNRIVKILDDFDAETKAITKAIQKEIALRNKQYQYYRDGLLSFQFFAERSGRHSIKTQKKDLCHSTTPSQKATILLF